MKIAAFDLASNTGVAVGDTGGDPAFWSERIGSSGEHHSIRFAACMNLADMVIQDHDPDVIAIEKPLTGIKEQSAIPFMLIGLRACVFGVARIRGVRLVEYSATSVRSGFLGKGLGRLPSAKAKRRVMEGCRLRGWKVNDHDEADALALWDYTRGMMKQKSITDLEAWAEGKD